MNINELENLRKKVVKRILICMAIMTIIIIILTYLGLFYRRNIPIFILLSYALSVTISNRKINEFKQEYKDIIVLEIFTRVFTDINYRPTYGIPEDDIASTKMMRMGDRYYSNDYISARYKNVPFEFSDVKIQNEYTDSDGDKHVETLFKGQWYIFDFNKKFKADIQVCEKTFSNAKRGGLFDKNKFNKVELEDIEFNKKFNVYAQNDLDAFYVLTPNTIEKIKELNNKIHGNILMCFIDNKLHIGLYNNKDLFEPSIFKKIDIEKNHKKVKEDILLITQFVDILSLDNDLFRREV